MEAVLEIGPIGKFNHTYLLQGTKCLAFIPQGHDTAQYFDTPLRFDRRGRRFERASIRLFQQQSAPPALTKVLGSRGDVYWINAAERTCTCPGFTFRGQCRHLETA